MSGALTGEWSRLLATSLAQAGLEHAVICPGSRSTPFAWALAETRGLTCHVLIDERAAAFFALGLARVTGRAALVLCTSGTAAANFFPAVVEASLARVPLLVLTADRPPELQAADAAQTIDQVKLYGSHAREFFDLGAPDPSPSALAGLRRIALQALGATLAPVPGPVHLNARARKPLEPAAAENDADRRVSEAVSALIARGAPGVVTAERALAATDVAKLGRTLAKARRGLIVCGPLPAHAPGAARAVRSLAQCLGMPLFAEATSGVRFDEEPDPLTADAFDLLVRTRECRARLAPDCIVRLGGTPTSSGLEALLSENPDAALHVIAEHGYPDALGRAQSVTVGPIEAVTRALLAVLARHEPNGEQSAFAGKIGYANAAAWQAAQQVLQAEPAGGEPEMVRAAIESLPPGGLLAVGNSLPVRLIDAFVPASARRLTVVSQRGANGIDGLVAGAAGSAVAAGAPALLLLGDVSFQHDLGGLAAARLVKSPLVILVLDNDGGRIFDHLPVSKLYAKKPERAELWLTPPRLALEHAAALFELPFAAPDSADALRAALGAAFERPCATLVHARVGPQSARSALQKIQAELDRTVPFR